MTNQQLNRGQIAMVARAAHEANRAYCLWMGDETVKPWETAGDQQHESAMRGVEGVLSGTTPEKNHESWLDFKRRQGWTWGPEKDEAAKKHPCMVPYDELPPEQKLKDAMFIGVVSACVAAAFGDAHLWVVPYERQEPEPTLDAMRRERDSLKVANDELGSLLAVRGAQLDSLTVQLTGTLKKLDDALAQLDAKPDSEEKVPTSPSGDPPPAPPTEAPPAP